MKKRPKKLGRKPGTSGRRRPVPEYVDETSPHRIFAAMSLGDRGHEDAVPDLKKLRDAEDGVVRSEASLPIWKITGDSSGALVVGRSLLDVFHIRPPGVSSGSSPTARSRRPSDFFRRFFRIAR